MTDIIDFVQLKQTLRNFAKLRKWEKFHTPKNLSMAIAGEAGELLEIFQWLTADESLHVRKNLILKEKVSYELADIILYIVRLADQLNINLSEATLNKIEINSKKYPVNLVKGSHKKYTEYNN